jgi:predicted XRE-type DNA-binding protein
MASKALAAAKKAHEKLTAQTVVRHLVQDFKAKDEILFSVFFLDGKQEKKMVETLVKHREAKGISQQEVAKAMKCTQSKISKLESKNINDVSLSDLKRYLDAVGLGCKVLFQSREL